MCVTIVNSNDSDAGEIKLSNNSTTTFALKLNISPTQYPSENIFESRTILLPNSPKFFDRFGIIFK
ncbi:hypothetical protein GL2_40050 [Microbulbifer sp. GL-2]|nr:hypothetical protein GL2_40050 [Microbulbifer sp. GL-2]